MSTHDSQLPSKPKEPHSYGLPVETHPPLKTAWLSVTEEKNLESAKGGGGGKSGGSRGGSKINTGGTDNKPPVNPQLPAQNSLSPQKSKDGKSAASKPMTLPTAFVLLTLLLPTVLAASGAF